MSTARDKLSEVAVIVPCYNAAKYLARALDSVLSQTHPNFQVYVIDDGSTDETARVMRPYLEYVSWIRQQHSGPAAARNHGISISKERYIAFLDADDFWLPAKLERQIALLKQNPSVGLVCSDCETLKKQKYTGSYFANTKMPATGRLFESLTRDCFIFTPTVLVRRQCLAEVGQFDESLAVSEDFHLWLRIAARWDIAVVPEVLAVREICAEGLSSSTRPEKYLENGIAALENVKSVCIGLTWPEARGLQKAIAQRYYVYGSYLLAGGHPEESRKKLTVALQRWPVLWRAWAKYGLTMLPGSVSRRLLESRRPPVRAAS